METVIVISICQLLRRSTRLSIYFTIVFLAMPLPLAAQDLKQSRLITGDDVIVRAEPEAPIDRDNQLLRLYRGETVQLIEVSDKTKTVEGSVYRWVQVSVDVGRWKGTGWVLEKFLGLSESEGAGQAKKGDCSRTPWLRAELSSILKKDCQDITPDDLAKVEVIAVRGKAIKFSLSERDLEGLTRLKTFILEYCGITGFIPPKFFEPASNLEVVSLAGNEIDGFGGSEEALLETNPKLRVLDLTKNSGGGLLDFQVNYFIRQLTAKRGIKKGESIDDFIGRKVADFGRLQGGALTIEILDSSGSTVVLRTSVKGDPVDWPEPPEDEVYYFFSKRDLKLIGTFSTGSTACVMSRQMEVFSSGRFAIIEGGSSDKSSGRLYELRELERFEQVGMNPTMFKKFPLNDGGVEVDNISFKRSGEDSIIASVTASRPVSAKKLACKIDEKPIETLKAEILIECRAPAQKTPGGCRQTIRNQNKTVTCSENVPSPC